MIGKNKDLDFLQEVSKKVSGRTMEGSPITPDEVFDIFNDTLKKMTDVRTIEVPIFMPIMIEKEDDTYIARSHVYRVCRGIGFSEEKAIQRLKEEIEFYNRTIIESEKKIRMEEVVKNSFPKDCF
ncbi:hypothetical protein [Neobacillus niacini]|uniref:hypothetical protein n=1 Tax=Neobacillus niacini TaxID=86668 RepID=UPI00285F0B07|nr:hypothetical protein [Neobacillus niacini]MDR7002672.1 putative RNase H-like HicB family nuclease [Neobacillus niacini]